MQHFNKEASKRIFSHTWYIYPLLAGLITVLWLWGFNAFHQPTKHQMLTLFFAANIQDTKFAKDIKEEHYEREKLRQVDTHGTLPGTVEFNQMLQIYLSQGDILVLDGNTLDNAGAYAKSVYFADITDEVKTQYLSDTYHYYTYVDSESVEHTCGVRLKIAGMETYLSHYMDFDETVDYYLTLGKGSVNLGILNGESNAPYDNALTFMKYLLELD